MSEFRPLPFDIDKLEEAARVGFSSCTNLVPVHRLP
jgi:hypothetical protein